MPMTFLAGSGERSGKQVVLTTRFGFIQPMIARFGEDHRAAASTRLEHCESVENGLPDIEPHCPHNAHPARK